jgi:hypothetical protein
MSHGGTRPVTKAQAGGDGTSGIEAEVSRGTSPDGSSERLTVI